MNDTFIGPHRLRYDYQERNKFDELAWLFPAYDAATAIIWPKRGAAGRISRYHESACQAHHVAGGMFGASRVDRVTNLIHLCDLTHTWCERYRNDGLALCYAAKRLKGEWDDTCMCAICGVPAMGAYLTTVRFEFPWVGAVLEKCERMVA